MSQFKRGFRGYGLDYCCGSAPVGFQLLLTRHKMDFIDIDGASGYEFLKWRLKKHEVEEGAGFEITGPYDFVLMLDAIEHLEDWESHLDNVVGRIRANGVLIINFFNNMDFGNPEHINMNHDKVSKFLVSRKLYPANDFVWVKKDSFMGGPAKLEHKDE
jgi:hypothetical protein